MGLFENLLKLRAQPPVTPAHAEAILTRAQKKHAAALAHAARCRRAVEDAVLDAAHNGGDEPARVHRDLELAMREETAAARSLDAAVAIHHASQSAERAARRRAQLDVVRSHLAASDAAAELFSQAQAEACRQFRVMVEGREAAMNSVPDGSGWPSGSMAVFGDLKHAAEAELFRLGGDASSLDGSRRFPGGKPHDSTFPAWVRRDQENKESSGQIQYS